jgi:hypothetical protein
VIVEAVVAVVWCCRWDLLGVLLRKSCRWLTGWQPHQLVEPVALGIVVEAVEVFLF